MTTLAIKIDVDTDRGTRIGVPNLLKLFKELDIPATFLFSLGPDNTGRAIKRIFRPGFLKKVSRTSIISTYGIRTLLNGVVLPGPHIGKKNESIIRSVEKEGHEVGIHCYDHIRWQDGVQHMSQDDVFIEFGKARTEFLRIFNKPAKTAGAAGWQANAKSLAAYDDAQLLYGSDCRGQFPFRPRVGETIFKTIQIPTTLPTLDELVGRPEYPINQLTSFYLNLIQTNNLHVFTTHAEIEGMRYLDWFREFLIAAKQNHIQFVKMDSIAQQVLQNPDAIPVNELIQSSVDGRSGTMAVQATVI